jgi:Arc/MetJ family transcription regulator
MGVADDDDRKGDERLMARAEEALTEIKVAQGLSERHEAVLAALRIRLKGDGGGSLEDLLAAAEDVEGPKLDDLLSKGEEPKRSLDDLLG